MFPTLKKKLKFIFFLLKTYCFTKSVVSQIFAEEVIIRKRPINITNDDLILFKHEFNKIIQPCYEVCCKNALITKKGHFFCNNTLIPESNSGEENYFADLYWNFEFEYAPNERIICCLFTAWSENYYHWFCDVLPKFMYLKQKGTLYNYLYYFPDFLQKTFVLETLKLLGVTYAFFDYTKLLFAKNLYYISLTADIGSFRPSLQQLTRSFFINSFCSAKQEHISPKKIYISRKKTVCRRISNEVEIETILAVFGFECYTFEDLSFGDQVQLMYQTKILISNHGAGLTNMLFLKEGSIVFELRQENDALNNCYFSLADALQCNYYYLLCKPQTINDYNSDIIVDVNHFKKIVKEITMTI